MDPGMNLGPRKQGGMASRFGGRGGPGRFNDQFGSEGNDGGFRGREGVFQDRDRDQLHGGANWDRANPDLERGRPRGGFINQGNNSQSGYREEWQRSENNRGNPNKRQMEDRERLDWEEQELRAKLRREQEERRFRDHNQRDETWDLRGKGKGMQSEPCFNCNLVGHMRKNCPNPPYCYCCKKTGHRSTVS
jgi:hypothetical protein